jgi:predicted nucleic acid-binding protein
MSKPQIYYWDSSVFVKHFNDEPGADNVEHFLDEAEQERVILIVSSITPVEVLKLKGEKPINKSQQNKIRGFFQKDYFRFVDLTRKIGERAQVLIWDHPGLWPKDAIHLASAIEFESISGLRLDAVHSYDHDFLQLNGKLPMKAPIVEPIPSQAVMQKILSQTQLKIKGKTTMELPPTTEEAPVKRIDGKKD